jgi:hypothetical protein
MSLIKKIFINRKCTLFEDVFKKSETIKNNIFDFIDYVRLCSLRCARF